MCLHPIWNCILVECFLLIVEEANFSLLPQKNSRHYPQVPTTQRRVCSVCVCVMDDVQCAYCSGECSDVWHVQPTNLPLQAPPQLPPPQVLPPLSPITRRPRPPATPHLHSRPEEALQLPLPGPCSGHPSGGVVRGAGGRGQSSAGGVSFTPVLMNVVIMLCIGFIFASAEAVSGWL